MLIGKQDAVKPLFLMTLCCHLNTLLSFAVFAVENLARQYLRKNGMTEIEFNQTGDFSAVNAARKWLQEQGYSYGSMCMDMPIGILKGSWCIAKWRNLTMKERKQLDGQMVSSDFRDGPVVIQLKDAATDEEIKAGKRIKQEPAK